MKLEKIRDEIFENRDFFTTRATAIEYCLNHPQFSYHDQSYRTENITDIFTFKDDSSLNIDTEKFVYDSDDSEIVQPLHWR